MTKAEREAAVRARVASAVDAIVVDLAGRADLDSAWYRVDDEVQEEIAEAWRAIVAAEVEKILKLVNTSTP
jgi:hypothetical protein